MTCSYKKKCVLYICNLLFFCSNKKHTNMKKKCEKERCGICLESVQSLYVEDLCKPCSRPSTCVRTVCGHIFHQGCLEKMVEGCTTSDKCPICRQDILETIFLSLDRDNPLFYKVGSGLMTCLALTISQSWSTKCLDYLLSGGSRQLRSQKQSRRHYCRSRPYDLNRLDHHGRTSLHLCMMMMHKETTFDAMNILLRWGSDPCIPSFIHQNTSLHLFLLNSYHLEHEDVEWAFQLSPFFESLIKYCKDVNQKNSSGTTAIHLSMRNAIPTYAIRLLEKGAYHSVEDSHGDTPLFYLFRNPFSMARNVLHMSSILVRHGASLDHKNKDGITPRMLRRKYVWRCFLENVIASLNGRCID